MTDATFGARSDGRSNTNETSHSIDDDICPDPCRDDVCAARAIDETTGPYDDLDTGHEGDDETNDEEKHAGRQEEEQGSEKKEHETNDKKTATNAINTKAALGKIPQRAARSNVKCLLFEPDLRFRHYLVILERDYDRRIALAGPFENRKGHSAAGRLTDLLTGTAKYAFDLALRHIDLELVVLIHRQARCRGRAGSPCSVGRCCRPAI